MREKSEPEVGGIPRSALDRYIREQICVLPGTDSPEDDLTILLTGSRGTGRYRSCSDVDFDVLCTQDVYDRIHSSCIREGVISTPGSFFVVAPENDWERYFGVEKGRPHFSLLSLDRVRRHFREYLDVWIWIWTHARVINDPHGRFQSILSQWRGYPEKVLVKKIKYHWLCAGYWSIEVFPFHHDNRDACLLAGSTAIINTVNELIRGFFLADNQPFPYAEKLMDYADSTRLGSQFLPLMQQVVERVVGRIAGKGDVWRRLEQAFDMLNSYDKSEECRRLTDACANMMIEAGVEPEWVTADFKNIDELLNGELGPVPG
jgi:hypothetical protein